LPSVDHPMNSAPERHRFHLVSLLTVTLVSAAISHADENKSGPAKPPPPEPVTLLVDLRTPPTNGFTYGSWQGRVATAASGLLIQGNKGADGSGETGQDFVSPRDLSRAEFIEVALGVGVSNKVPAITVAFDDAADTQYAARILIDQIVPEQPVWLRVRRSDFKLNNWQGNKGSAVIDWTRIARWHLQGDWSKAVPLVVVFIALRTRP